jgi:phage tail sheath protein FI
VSPDGSARIRRLLNYIEQSIDKATQFAVFEPNDERLWESVQRAVENFLRTVWRSGVLQGSTADEAYFVRCDRTTMTQDDLDNGRLVLLVGVAPAKPAEFEILRISQPTGDVPQG